VLTIAIDNKKRQITQACGKFNLQPHGKISKAKHRKTDGPYQILLRESGRIMAIWRAREGLAYRQD